MLNLVNASLFISSAPLIINSAKRLDRLLRNAIYPISALKNKFNPQNTTGMSAVKLIFRLELKEIFIP